MSYNPEIGRWVEEDPTGYADGMNLYQAFDSNPVTNTDPDGLNPWSSDSLINHIKETDGYKQLVSDIKVKCDSALKAWAEQQGCKDASGPASASDHAQVTYVNKNWLVDQLTVGRPIVYVTATGTFNQTHDDNGATATCQWTFTFSCQKDWHLHTPIWDPVFKHYDLSWTDTYSDTYSHQCCEDPPEDDVFPTGDDN
jgi:hypothetical protein